ncbi:WD40-repeat-containing domain protein [Ganoderma leucocontextum]|nr:WD40-repeat-containing domain protein [Ganoderma leucocontextum]
MSRAYSEQARLPEGHVATITAIAFSPKGRYLATAGLDGKICIWDISDCHLICVYQASSHGLSLSWVPRREDKVLVGMANGYVVSLSFSASVVKAHGIVIHNFPVECLAMDGTRVASGAHRELRVWDWQAEGPWYQCAEVTEPSTESQDDQREVLVTSVHWTKRQLVVSYLNHGIHIFDRQRWACLRVIEVDGQIVRGHMSSDGQSLVMSNLLTRFDLYDLISGDLIRAFGHDVGEKRAMPVKFTELDDVIVGGTTVGTMHAWDANTGRRVQTLVHSGGHCDNHTPSMFRSRAVFASRSPKDTCPRC